MIVPLRRPIPVNLKRCPAARQVYLYGPKVTFQYSTLEDRKAFEEKMRGRK